MQNAVDTFTSHGASVVVFSPQLPQHSQTMIDRHGLSFPLLSDHGNDYAEDLGLRFTVPEDLREVYLSLNINLPEHNGEASWTLPIPARFVIGQDGIVRAADVDPDYTHRPEVDKTLQDVMALVG